MMMDVTKQMVVCMQANPFRQELVDVLKQIVLENDLDISLSLVTDDLEMLVQYLDKSTMKHLYIIDATFSTEVDGFKLAKYIRMFDASGFILLFTSEEVNYSRVFENKLEVVDYLSIHEVAIFYDKMEENLKYINEKK